MTLYPLNQTILGPRRVRELCVVVCGCPGLLETERLSEVAFRDVRNMVRCITDRYFSAGMELTRFSSV